MAETIWRKEAGDQWECFSAGSNPAGYVHPLAQRVLSEIGIDTTSCRSKSVSEFARQPFDLVITVCDNAHKACPAFPGAKEQLHWPFDDPAHAQGTTDEQLAVFRRVRDEIRSSIGQYLAASKVH
jgi:arsenate reductase